MIPSSHPYKYMQPIFETTIALMVIIESKATARSNVATSKNAKAIASERAPQRYVDSMNSTDIA